MKPSSWVWLFDPCQWKALWCFLTPWYLWKFSETEGELQRGSGSVGVFVLVSKLRQKEKEVSYGHKAIIWAAIHNLFNSVASGGVGCLLSRSVFMQLVIRYEPAFLSYFMSRGCEWVCSNFTQNKRLQWKRNFQSSRLVARRVNSKCSNPISAVWRNGKKRRQGVENWGKKGGR